MDKHGVSGLGLTRAMLVTRTMLVLHLEVLFENVIPTPRASQHRATTATRRVRISHSGRMPAVSG